MLRLGRVERSRSGNQLKLRPALVGGKAASLHVHALLQVQAVSSMPISRAGLPGFHCFHAVDSCRGMMTSASVTVPPASWMTRSARWSGDAMIVLNE